MNPCATSHAVLGVPDPISRFAGRAARLRRLAEGHAAAARLGLIARIADGQRAAVRDVEVPLVASAQGGTPLPYDRVARDPSWRRMLAVVVGSVGVAGLPEETLLALQRLTESSAAQLEELADLMLAGSAPPFEPGLIPFLAAALQAWFGVLAARIDPGTLHVRGSACPACGAPPVAGLVDATTRRRYIACSLCGVRWNVPRLTCVSCQCDSDLAYYRVEGEPGAKAEACAACDGYFKLFDLELRPGADPVADDAATQALDALAKGGGFERIGANPFRRLAAS